MEEISRAVLGLGRTEDLQECKHCGKKFQYHKSLLRHLRRTHAVMKNFITKKKSNIRCPAASCDETFITRAKLRKHLSDTHSLVLDEELMEFSSFEEFEQWKIALEREINCCYMGRHTPQILSTNVKTYYFSCFRSRGYQGSKWMDGSCPSTMDVTVGVDGKTSVRFWKTHSGHGFEIEHFFLSSTGKLDIASIAEEKTAASLQEFLCILHDYQLQTFSKFVCIKSNKVFTEENFKPRVNMKIYWNDCEPYYNVGHRLYACHKGKDLNLGKKKKYTEKRNDQECNHNKFIQRRNLTQPTKKLGCPAVFKVSRLLSLPKYKVDTISEYKKRKMTESIKTKIIAGEDICGENRYCFTLPTEDSHNHVNKPSESRLPKSQPIPVEDDQSHETGMDCIYSGDSDSPEEEKRWKKTSDINSLLRSLHSITNCLDDDHLEKLRIGLVDLLKETALHVRSLETKSSTKRLSTELPKPVKRQKESEAIQIGLSEIVV